MRINPIWKEKMLVKLNERGDPEKIPEDIDVVTGFNKSIQWLIMELTERGIPFKLYNLGAGAKRVTTNTDKCPMCKRKLK